MSISGIVISDSPVLSRPHYNRTFQPTTFKDYTHEIRAMGGYWGCSFTLYDGLGILTEFIENGLARDVRAFCPNGEKVFEGLIVELTLNLPQASIKVSLLEMANRVQLRYTTSADGLITRSTQYNDTDSQALYGIKERIFAGAEMDSSTVADQTAQMLLSVFKYPSSPVITPKLSEEVSLTVKVHGYVRTLDWRVYNQTTNTGTESIDTQIDNVVTDVGEFIASTNLVSNATVVPQLQDEDVPSWQVITGAAQQADSSNNRYVVGVYENRQLIYEQAAGNTLLDVSYLMKAMSGSGEIYGRESGIELDKSSIRPNKWIRYTDILGFMADGSDLYTDPRVTYIESAIYTDPDKIMIIGNRGKLPEIIMAKASLGGMTLV